MMTTIAIWCLIFGLYLLLAGEVSRNEVVVAFALTSFATAWARLIRACTERHFSGRLDLGRALVRPLAHLPRATAQTGLVLGRVVWRGGSPGRAGRARFSCGAKDDAREASRRALAIIGSSLAPDRFVVDVDCNNRTALLHDLVRSDREPDERWLT